MAADQTQPHPGIEGMRLVVRAAEGELAAKPDATAAELLRAMNSFLALAERELNEMLRGRPRGACRHCGYPVVVVGNTAHHEKPDGSVGDRGCRAALFWTDRDRWHTNPPELQKRYAKLA